MFPGNMSYINNSPPKVLLSANTGVVIEDENEKQAAFVLNLGLQPMVQLVNDDSSILPNFELELYETDCGYAQFDYNYASKCMKKHVDKIGVAHIASPYSTVLTSYLDLFKEMNVEVPHITISYNEPKLYDKDLYLEVLVTIPNSLYYYIILPYILKSFRWNNLILIQDGQIGESDISAFIENTEILNINIFNSMDDMCIPFHKTENYYKDVEHIMKFIKDSKCRIITLFTYNNSHRYFIEALYDFGFRRGDLALVMITNVSILLNQSENYGINRKKTLEIVNGSLSIEIDKFVGEYGQELEKQIAAIVGPYPTIYSCFKIDSLMLAVHSIDLMINSGSNFDDFQDLMSFIRGIRFTGCTGMISIDSGGNGLSDIVYTIWNFYEEDGKEYENIAAVYTFGVMVPLKISKEIVWPSGTTEVPRDLIEETKCRFPDILIKDNPASRELSGIVTCSLFMIIVIVTGLVWRHFDSPKIEFLEEKREMMFEDGVLLYFPLIETAQFIGLGPDFYHANFVLSFVCSWTSLDFGKVIYFEFEDFWTIIIITLAVTSFWCFCFGFKLTIEDRCLPHFIKDSIEVVGFKFIQIFSGAGFVGVNFVLFNIFRCEKGIGDKLTQSFLHNDCKTFCWEGAHLYFLIAICAVIVVFNFFAISSRLAYDRIMDYVSVKVFPLYALVKGFFQLCLLILSLHLKDEYPRIYSVVYCVLFIGWVLFVFKVDCYNYHRLNSWVRVFGLGLCAHQFLMIGYANVGIPDLAFVILQIIIILGCTGVGFYYQVRKFPSMLFRKKGRNFDKLLKFTFTKRVKAGELTEHELDYVRRIEYEMRE